MPGVLTGFAAAVTAVTGLIVALPKACVHRSTSSTPVATAATCAEPRPGGISSAGNVIGTTVSFPSGDEILIGEGNHRVLFKVLSGAVEERTDNTLALSLRLRVTNYTSVAVFCGNSLGLLVDKVQRSPVGTTHLDTPVDSNSARDAQATFELPHGAHRVTLTVVDPRSNSGDTCKLPLDLAPPKS